MVKLKMDVDPELPGSGDHDDDGREGEDNNATDNNDIVLCTDLDDCLLVDVMMVDEVMGSTLNDENEQDDLDVVGQNSMTQVVIQDLESCKTDNMTDAIDCECRLHSSPFRRLLQQIRSRVLNTGSSSTCPPKDRNDDDDDDGTNSVRTDTTEATAIMIMRPSTSTGTDNMMTAPELFVGYEDVEMNSNSNLSNQVAADRSNGYDSDNDDFVIVIPGPNSSLRVSPPAHSYLFGRMGPCQSKSSCCPIIICIIACCAAGLIVVYFAFSPSNDINE